MSIDWNNYTSKITEHFTVHDALYLPSWRIYHTPSDAEKNEIIKTAGVMEKIRKIFNSPIIIHCWMRPLVTNCPTSVEYNGKNYNKFVGSKATNSPHITGQAVDFHVIGYEGPDGCKRAREIILPHLVEFDIRMEDQFGGWIHVDTKPVINSRFFKP